MQRSNHNLSHDVKLTFDMGQIVPIGCTDVIPGDTFDQDSRALLRVSPLLAPVMHRVDVDIMHFFVPNRIMWDDWEKFITGGPDGEDATVAPYVTVPVGGFDVGTLADYLGIPPDKGAGDTVSALPFRAYAMIYNEWFRDEDLVSPIPVVKTNGSDTTTNTDLQRGAWKKDYFTSARTDPQKGPPISIPLTGNAPVAVAGANSAAGTEKLGILYKGTSSSTPYTMWSGNNELAAYNQTPTSNYQLFADTSALTAVTIADLRLASALQRYEENNARGNRYNELLLHRFGVRSSDARLQLPEFLGGGRETIQFSEVLQTANDVDSEGETVDAVGTMRGHGIATIKSNRYRKFFEEHGYVISVMIVRPKPVYADGLHRSWSRTTKEDYFTPELQLIGNQEILNKEVDLAHAQPDTTWGYQWRYDEYRSQPSRIAGEFRTILDFWTMSRIFETPPALNATFITCTPTDRIYAVPIQNQLWVQVHHKLFAKRGIVKKPNPRLM